MLVGSDFGGASLCHEILHFVKKSLGIGKKFRKNRCLRKEHPFGFYCYALTCSSWSLFQYQMIL